MMSLDSLTQRGWSEAWTGLSLVRDQDDGVRGPHGSGTVTGGFDSTDDAVDNSRMSDGKSRWARVVHRRW
jgi:hypothetical protein